MNVLIMIGQLLLGLSILVVLHELGHFLAARAFGIKVEKFYLFFDAWGFKLFKFDYKGVEYGIGWLPLGGYVKIAGMIDESMDTEAMKQPAQPWEFRSKPAWQRLIVMLGGIFVNVILGIFIFWMLTLKYGDTFVPIKNLAYGISPGIVGKELGLQNGDKIVAVNDKKIVKFDELISSKVLLGNSKITIDRNGTSEDIMVPPNILDKVSDYGIGEFVRPRVKFAIDSIEPGKNAEKAGLMPKDSIVAINNQPINFYDELQESLKVNKRKQINLTVVREGKRMDLPANISREGKIGFAPAVKPIETETVDYGFLAALPIGTAKAWGSLTDNAKGLGRVFTGDVSAKKAFQGPIGIAKMYGSSVDWEKFWSLTGLLSMALALMNLLPIPALDGGHATFLIVEMIKGKPLSDKFMEKAQMVGFFILIALMIFVWGNDILKAVGR